MKYTISPLFITHHRPWLFVACFLLSCCHQFIVSGESNQLITLNGNGKIVYGSDNEGNRIPDFSHCGYMGGGVALPDVPVRLTLSPDNSNGDDTERIQQAIDKLAQAAPDKTGFRGALLLKKGSYRVADTLFIKESGIILRGEGNGTDGTLIIATGTKVRPLIQVGAGKPGNELADTRKRIADAFVPVGAVTFSVDSKHTFRAGDAVVVRREANDEWISTIGTKGYGWKANEYGISYERIITQVKGNDITIDAPVVCAIDKKFGGGYVCKITDDSRIQQVGIEHMRLQSEYKKGQEKSDEDHAWDAIKIVALRDGWVKNVTAVYFGYSCVNIGRNGKRITVQDCACLDPVSKITGGRRYSFALAGELCLVQRCYTRHGRHDYVMHARVPGPNVFLDCVADNTHSDSGPHHRWATGTLYDNVRCGPLNVRNRGSSGTGHGWVAAATVLWNCRASGITCDSPPRAQNYSFGSTGKIKGNGHIESSGKPMKPRSLYLQQLEDRLGSNAVKQITIAEQRAGILDDLIRKELSQ